MKTRIAILGAGGRMGRALLRCVLAADDLDVAAAIEEPHADAVGRDAGELAGAGTLGVLVSTDRQEIVNADVVIDFTFHTAAPHNAALAANHGKPLVVGTTALSGGEEAALREAAQVVPVVYAPNMSRGVNLLYALVRQAAAALGLEYDVEIVETHHRLKQDAPSGTAMALAREVAAARDQDPAAVIRHGREGQTGERPRGDIGMHAVRGGAVVGEHTVAFISDHERVELSHRAASRDMFALGALEAARWLEGRPPGLYTMADVLGLPKGA